MIDSSAVLAIPLEETGSQKLATALNGAPSLMISAASVLEISLVLDSLFNSKAGGLLDRWLESVPVEVMVVNKRQVEIGRDAFRRFGKGWHPAALNLGHCFSYALARVTGEPLLFKGYDFSRTDIRSAIAS